MRGSWFLPVASFLGFAFLYIPILSLIIYSFNDSQLVTVWGGFSTRWYGELLNDAQILGAAWISLKVGLLSATIATVIGTLAAFVLTRFGRFRGRLLMTGMVTAPLVMPEVLIGLSLLLLFVSMELALGWPSERGMVTVVIAHSTFCAAYVAVIAQSRLRDMDDSLEEAARDLGAGPLRVFFDITIPVIAPALVSGWLLAFTLSLDDLVIASFVSGPGASTLPMVIFSKVRLGVSPDVNALATLIILVVAIAVSIAGWVLYRQARRG
ncbi:MAG: ABC-type putrescine uptake system permease component PotI [Roseibaca calidilacus]|uniref:ABC-type putrescine uptake system permease component PotI n=1 Tax=Roseibaca calidilacus TaxID=1666912 RepID=A0A0P7WNI7_9RHOB|nr:ABC transporter permease subunit [Roseibaca calidilacus]KPP92403.1 MAG: ABC-type putrescine uptake system permease component PotI [Roseibaca calidilacus]CUX79699.1 putrescine transport system permease protein [Roseibaca calidilacus]